ncbi:hypothetical protein [uncultured Rhodoblastus sp.]|uniref:hypothetical protein n=1 Tax=uncultured Rhodoblastus sp. TaxID=543037 RepID=UPI0025FDEDAA|nr:hypothetical protein [uncultured Rhodoblastus sp.]
MPVYRLDPIDPGHPSWRYSAEKNPLWTNAPSPSQARDLVAAKTGFDLQAHPGALSPWQDEKVTSCTPEPTMDYPGPGEVIREDGSNVTD